MINQAHFHGFKALRDLTIDLERLTVFVGPNSSGKTSILEGLNYLMIAAAFRADQVIQGEGTLRSLRTTGQDGEMALECCSKAQWIRFSVRPAHVPEQPQDYRKPPAGFSGVGRDVRDNVELDGEKFRLMKEFAGELLHKQQASGPAVFLRLDAKRLIAPSYSVEPVPRIEQDGEGVASVLSYLASNRPETFEAILDGLREIVPIVRNIRFPRAPVIRAESEVITVDGKPFTYRGEKTYWGSSLEFDMEGAPRIPARAVSEGILLVLGVLTAIMGPNRPSLVLLDDLERGLHPKAQADMIELLRRLLDHNPEMQIVATSHSPYLLDHLRPDEVRLTTLKDDGSVACSRLDEHPEFDKWKDAMAPGEFWSLVGEKWVAEAAAKEKV